MRLWALSYHHYYLYRTWTFFGGFAFFIFMLVVIVEVDGRSVGITRPYYYYFVFPYFLSYGFSLCRD